MIQPTPAIHPINMSILPRTSAPSENPARIVHPPIPLSSVQPAMHIPVRSATVLLFLSSLLSLGCTQPAFTRSYRHGPITLSPSSALSFSVNIPKDRIYLGVFISDPHLLSDPSASPPWAGLGIGEPTSGSMLGADIVTIEFAPIVNTTSAPSSACTLVDRYVPWTAHPLTTAPGPFPLPDDCPEPDWALVSCTHDPDSGSITFEVSRSLAIDASRQVQDRPIVSGSNPVLVAHGMLAGGAVTNHGGNRVSTRVTFFTADDTGFDLEPNLPPDVDGSFIVRATDYELPTRRTTYTCTSARIPLHGRWREGRMIVAAEPVISQDSAEFVHHFVAYLCSGASYFEKTKTTKSCFGEPDAVVDGPGGNPEAMCSTIVFAFAVGSGRFVLPPGVGFAVGGKGVGKGKVYIVLETHYDNAIGIPNFRDSSGVRLFYTNTAREHAAGTLMLGDQLLSLLGRPVVSGFEYQFTCPSACTQRMNRSINLFTSLLHMHYTGRKVFTNVYDRDANFKQQKSAANFWSNSFQMIRVHDPPIVLNPGDQLSTTCVYDLSKKASGINFGAGTDGEMCADFAMYWPVQFDDITGHEFSLCSLLTTETPPANVTYCGDPGRFSDFFTNPEKFPLVPNPAFIDTVGAPTTFGAAQDEDECGSKDASAVPTQTTTEIDGTVPPQAGAAEMEDDNANQTMEEENGSETAGSGGSENIMSPSPSAEVQDSSDSDAVCFPANAWVQLRGGAIKRMEDVEIGDELLVDREKNIYSPVFLFTHRDAQARYSHFVTVLTSSNRSLTVTAGHYVYVDGSLRQARKIRLGQRLEKGTGMDDVVVEVRHHLTERGLFNPQTLHGDVVVNGILTSTFTQSVPPVRAQALLVPVRTMFLAMRRMLGNDMIKDWCGYGSTSPLSLTRLG